MRDARGSLLWPVASKYKKHPIQADRMKWISTAIAISGALWLVWAAWNGGEAGAIILFVLALAFVVMTRWKPKEERKLEQTNILPSLSDNYGAASFAPVMPTVKDGRDATRGLFLGQSSASDASGRAGPVFTTPERHTLIVAQTPTGKGSRVIIPTLLRYRGSVLAVDPKDESAAVTARARRHPKHLSEILGKRTIRTASSGYAYSKNGETPRGESTTYAEAGRDLLTTDDIIHLGRDIAIAIQPHGGPPTCALSITGTFRRRSGTKR
ncbi:MAG: type IV secretory system conjugative DNA transfer family protein [Pseudomonadota bacterium]|nr:type IV secretory system conjugative DNA transfer family protein [Pseudomonadota bacterium]